MSDDAQRQRSAKAIRETTRSGATTMTLAEYHSLSPRETAALLQREYGGTGGVSSGPLGSDWVETDEVG